MSTVEPRAHRGTIFPERGRLRAHDAHPGAQYVLRVAAPRAAATARPGSFAHVQCDPELPMRRPLSIMRAEAEAGWLEFLYKAVGHGTARLARRQPGETLDLLAPIGRPFTLDPARPRGLLLGGGVGLPPMVFLAERMRLQAGSMPVVFLGSEIPFPFPARPSQLLLPGMPDGAIGCMPLLDDWGVPCRLASRQGYPGCHDGYVTDLARHWLDALAPASRAEVTLYACGPEPMLAAAAALARDYALPGQLSLEEYMACAVGGCAGCVVEIATPAGVAMKRVCVDGPVFAADSVVGFQAAAG
ncbi:MAG TPA: dihydroorotate dehydrogenase electron transfer subunit [Gammaproteobacteria bacterium]